MPGRVEQLRVVSVLQPGALQIRPLPQTPSDDACAATRRITARHRSRR